MRTKVTLALLFLNVALFFFIFYIRPDSDQGGKGEDPSRLVLPSAASDVRQLEITVGTETTRLVRRGEQWTLSAPIDWPANPHAVSHMLTELQSLKHETSFTVASLAQNKLSLADYGLEKPAMSVKLTTAQTNPGEEPRSYTLLIGNTTKVENRLYLLSADGTRIHVVSRSLAESLTLPLDQLRASALFTIPDFEVRNFTIQPSAAVSARTRIRRDGTRWTMENPVQTRANATAVRTALAQLAGLQIDTFISQPLSPELSPSSATSLRIALEGNNRSETLLLGAPVPREGGQPSRAFYAQFEWKIDGERKSAVFTVTLPQALLETLRSAQERLRETRILDLDTAALSSINLRAPGQPDLTLQRLDSATPGEGERWQLVRRIGDAAPTTVPADPAAVRNLVGQLVLLNASRFVTDAPGSADLESWGFNNPERTIVLQSEEVLPARPATSPASPATPPAVPQSVTLQLGLGADRANKAYARLTAAPYVYEVEGEILTHTRPDPRLWRDRRLQDLPAGARISALRITDLATGATAAECRFPASAGAPVAEAAGSDETRAAWSALAASLRGLSARSFIAEHYAPTFTVTTGEHTWKYRLAIEVTLQTGAGEQVSTQELDLSERLGGTLTVAGSAKLDALFELEQPLVDALWTILYNASKGTTLPAGAPPSFTQPAVEQVPVTTPFSAPAAAAPAAQPATGVPAKSEAPLAPVEAPKGPDTPKPVEPPKAP